MRARCSIFIAIPFIAAGSFSAVSAEPATDIDANKPEAPISLLTGLERALRQEPSPQAPFAETATGEEPASQQPAKAGKRIAKATKAMRTVDAKQLNPPLNEQPADLAATDESAAETAGETAKLPRTKAAALTDAGKPAEPVRSLIAQHAAANNVPFGLADAVIKVESRYNPGARNGVNLGLGQINLRTARGLGYGGGAGGLLNANTNLTYSIKYLAQAYRLAGGDTCGAIMRYQNGTASTRFTGANRAYCSKVKSHIGAIASR